LAIRDKIAAVPAGEGHAFMVSTADKPAILIAVQGREPASLSELIILRYDLKGKSYSALSLPTDLSDGRTTAAQYLESKYYKELQQLVEQSLAMPLNGYLIQPRTTDYYPQPGWASVLTRQPKPAWLDSTITGPWWLKSMPPVRTNLDAWQLTQLVWLARDADDSQVAIENAPAEMFRRNSDRNLIANPAKLDALVAEVLGDPEAHKQGISVVIKNATEVDGMAGLVGRFAGHLGGDVIAVEASDSGQENSSMTSDKSSRLSAGVASSLGVPLTKTPLTGRERSDMEIIVGVDLVTRIGTPIDFNGK
jgi:hypothetical protein